MGTRQSWFHKLTRYHRHQKGTAGYREIELVLVAAHVEALLSFFPCRYRWNQPSAGSTQNFLPFFSSTLWVEGLG